MTWSGRARGLLYALSLSFFVLSLLGSWGGPDLFGETGPAFLGALLLVWFGAELRGESGRWMRRILWFGVVAAALMIVGSLGELFFA